MNEEAIKRLAAETFCRYRGVDPNALEAGDVYGVDGYMQNGDPAHFRWRQYADHPATLDLVRGIQQMLSPVKVSAEELPKHYRCGVCGSPDPCRYMRCNHAGCPDGRDR